jgi:hypothetical protein
MAIRRQCGAERQPCAECQPFPGAKASQQLRDRQLVIAQAWLAIEEQTIALELLSGTPIEGWK